MAPNLAPTVEDVPAFQTLKMHFRSRITAGRNDPANPPLQYTVPAIEDYILARWGSPVLNMLETFRSDAYIKPFADFERYYPARPADAEIQVLHAINRSALTEHFDEPDTSFLACASRHGTVTKAGQSLFKVSLRYYIQGYKIQARARDLGRWFKDSEELSRLFDMGVYPMSSTQGEQLLGCVGCCKAINGDVRVLEPMDPPRPFHAFLIQALKGDEKLLTPHCTSISPPPPVRRRVDPGPVAKPAWLTLSDVAMQRMAAGALEEAGLVDGIAMRACRNNLVSFDTQGQRSCLHDTTHTSNSFSVSFQRDGFMRYHCTSDRCSGEEPVQLGRWRNSLAERLSMDALTEAQTLDWSAQHLADLERDVQLQSPQAKKLEECEHFQFFAAHAREYTDRFFKHVFISKPEVLQVQYSADGHVVKYTRRTLGSAREVTMHGGAAFNLWLMWARKSSYVGYFAHPNPARVPPLHFNTMTATFPMRHVPRAPLTPAELQTVQPILQLLREGICCGVAEHFEYLIRWLAVPLQELGARTGVALLVHGAQGTGKSLVFDVLMAKLYGEFHKTLNNKDELLHKFNVQVEGRLFLLADEAGFFLGKHDETARLKNLITGSRMQIEAKGLDPVTVENFANLVLCTNETTAVKIDNQDRRWAVLETSCAHRNDRAYFLPLVELIEDPSVPPLFYRYLVTLDLAGFDVRSIPDSSAKLALQVTSRSAAAHWLQHIVQRPPAGMISGDSATAHFNLGPQFAFEEFAEWAKGQPSYLHARTIADFVRDMKALGFRRQTCHVRSYGSQHAWKDLTLAGIKAQLIAQRAWDRDAEVDAAPPDLTPGA